MALAGSFASSKPIQNDAVVAAPPKPLPSPSIIERFRAALKEREEELRASSMPVIDDDDDVIVLPPTMDEIVRLYELFLSDLTFNSKPVITDLTIIAGEQREHGQGIADAICSRILEVPVEQKLPSLYLLDSIVKNIGRDYVRHFSAHLPEVFCEAYRQVHPSMHPAMRHLFGTWSTVFPAPVLRKIETRLQFSQSGAQQSSGLTSSRASESPRPTHGIHVNPKYLEARRQLGHSTIDSVRAENLAGHISSDLEAKQVLSTASKNARSSSPYRVGPARSLSPTLDEFAVDNSAIGLREGASPSHSALDYGLNRVRGRDDERNEWQRILPDDANQQPDIPVKYGLNKDFDLQGPRALIDAYGIDEREKLANQRQRKMGNAAMNGLGERIAVKTWQNTEEEEFNWEDMSPTLVDQSPFNDLSTSVRHPQSIRTRPGLDSQHAVPLVTDPRRSWSNRGQYSSVHDPSLDDVHSSGRGARNKITGYCDETSLISGSHYLQKLPENVPLLHQRHLKVEGSGISLVTGEPKHPLISNLVADGHTWRPPYIPPRMNPTFDSSVQDIRAVTGRAPIVPWPPTDVHNPQSLTSKPFVLPHQHIRSPFEVKNASSSVVNHNLDKSVLPGQRIDNSKSNSYIKFPQFPSQHLASFSASLQNSEQVAPAESQLLFSQRMHQTTVPSASIPASNHLLLPPIYGYNPQGPGSSVGTLLPLPVSGPQVSLPLVNIPNTSSQFSSGAFPPLPRGPLPMSSQFTPTSQNLGQVTPNPPAGGFSSLISSLMAQGLISLTNQAPPQDSVGLDFNPDLLKVRHDSAVTALYADLPRQCKTCGLRFKCQEAHSSHMDWHVTKNRVSKNRKQKSSRKWFVSVNMWLSGTEALGSDAAPGFLPTEQVVEKKDDEELAVPADDEQNVCALCGEPFDDFYSDETEEWMYKGAVYMNAPSGSTAGMKKSQLGPIIHAKCRSESSATPHEDSRRVDEGLEDGSQRKRMRS
ncbi:PREDICTED: polyadenylation and cleavage factor homolog 4 [Nicotiana attenuata]|uniref:Polyadenylation and cleavage factor -like 4 n=1 Tax=Nicotiana attenuata TaxID=49451 RepID=A0A1J6IE62_NICAT|nr:PREDICTED: polyadenylation and cleavage factor homolog 4 [Nicotiana attenuata]OIS96062.1 polyadenylation and cleavage factor -like 4 [Nicotiana attenuata]